MSAAGQDWYEYQKGIVLEIDAGTGNGKVVFEYVSPPEACPPVDPAILFKSGTLVGDRMYLCTQTEILVLRVPGLERIAYLSLPLFTDLHHVRPTPAGDLLVANTGLDMVLEVTVDGVVTSEWNVLGEDPWERFSRD